MDRIRNGKLGFLEENDWKPQANTPVYRDKVKMLGENIVYTEDSDITTSALSGGQRAARLVEPFYKEFCHKCSALRLLPAVGTLSELTWF